MANMTRSAGQELEIGPEKSLSTVVGRVVNMTKSPAAQFAGSGATVGAAVGAVFLGPIGAVIGGAIGGGIGGGIGGYVTARREKRARRDREV